MFYRLVWPKLWLGKLNIIIEIINSDILVLYFELSLSNILEIMF